MERINVGKLKWLGISFAFLLERGGLGIQSLELFNKALMTKHIWNIVSNNESLWVRWIHVYKLKGRSFWVIPLNATEMSWGWRKLPQLRALVRPFIWANIGNGNRTSAWYDIWDPHCLLSVWISPRDIYEEVFFTMKSCNSWFGVIQLVIGLSSQLNVRRKLSVLMEMKSRGIIGPLDGLLCRRCTCEWCGNNLRNGLCLICDSGAVNSFVYDPNPNSINDPPNFFNHPPQPQFESYSCELCGNGYHYGYDCPPRVPLVYEQEPCYNQNFGDNYYLQNSLSFPQQYLCCENCGGPHANFQCQPRNQNFYEPNLCYNSNSSGFDQPPQYSIDHQFQEDLNQQRMYDNEWIDTHTPEPSRRFNSICYDDDDDEESTIPLNEIISQIPPSIAITPVLPTMEPEDSLIMRDENLSTIPKKEPDEFIKYSVEDLVPIPRESEDTSSNDKECDLPFCYNYVTFSNPLFDANDDFTSSNEGVPEENIKIYSNPLFDFDEEYISSDVNPLFKEVLEDIENKDSYVSNLDEPRLLTSCHTSFHANKDDILTQEAMIEGDFDAFLDIDVSMDIEDGYHDSEGDIIYLEWLLTNDTTHNLPPEVFLDHYPRSLKDEPDNDDLKSMVKFQPRDSRENYFSDICENLSSESHIFLSMDSSLLHSLRE
ncbi:hypothetical protein Tco_1110047 [Tanacetum coccineum]|uniref:Uncharacterized protein n=1 Tax=Tanacetum coccineum TaxID=301880 RepID=A0ABQ5IHQ7_9ASTR